jgi:hypothetical protein
MTMRERVPARVFRGIAELYCEPATTLLAELRIGAEKPASSSNVAHRSGNAGTADLLENLLDLATYDEGAAACQLQLYGLEIGVALLFGKISKKQPPQDVG